MKTGKEIPLCHSIGGRQGWNLFVDCVRKMNSREK